MKIGGIDPKTLPTEEVLVLPRGDQRLVFRARPVGDMEEFEKLCPPPRAPGKLTKDGYVPDTGDPNYKSLLDQHNRQRVGYIVIRSLEASEIEWDTVRAENPATWTKWDDDLRAGGLTQVEVNHILSLVWEANSLSEERLKKAREVFLAGPPTV